MAALLSVAEAASGARDFYRVSRLPPYVFAEVNKVKAEARARGEDIIDFGMGNPDSAAPAHVIEKLRETALDPTAHGYSVSSGIRGLRKALSGYYERRFGVELDPDTEVASCMGSKEGLFHLAVSIGRPSDVILCSDPSYPIHPYGYIIADSSVKLMKKDFDAKNPEEAFLNQVKEAVESISPKPLALIVNYPCNPTAEVVSIGFYEQLVDICRHYGIILISDLAYCEIYFDGNPPPSVLQVKGAKDIAVEFTTMSKSYSMAGWRVGFCAGNKEIVGALKRIKSYLDYGAFTPIQVAAAVALNGSQDCVAEFRQLYKDRRDVMVKGLHEAGWMVPEPKASMFIWTKMPEKFNHMSSVEFCKKLMVDAKVAVAPGAGFGAGGEGYVRIGLVENVHRSRQALRNIKKFLK
jgi:alanine-synthesizing transaminase